MVVGSTTYAVASSYKTNDKNIEVTIAKNTNQKKVNASSLNIRSGPGLNYKTIGSLKRGTTIETVEQVGIWHKVKYKSSYGWCSGDYLLPTNASNNNTNNSNQKLPKGHCLIVKTSNNTMEYYKDGKLIKEFVVATGKKSTPTPKGQFKIVNKTVNMPYYKYNIPGGDPRNPLGNRWLGIKVGQTDGTTYGIHGNNDENSIGQSVSAGCIRMHNEEINWLFEQVPKGTTVIIE